MKTQTHRLTLDLPVRSFERLKELKRDYRKSYVESVRDAVELFHGEKYPNETKISTK